MEELLIHGLSVGYVVYVIVYSNLSQPIRGYFTNLWYKQESKFWWNVLDKFNYLLTCPFCCSFWVAGAFWLLFSSKSCSVVPATAVVGTVIAVMLHTIENGLKESSHGN